MRFIRRCDVADIAVLAFDGVVIHRRAGPAIGFMTAAAIDGVGARVIVDRRRAVATAAFVASFCGDDLVGEADRSFEVFFFGVLGVAQAARFVAEGDVKADRHRFAVARW